MATDDALLEKPIVIIGSPRSGTTVLGEILMNHRELAYAEEPRLTWRYGNDKRSDMLRPDDARPDVVRHIRRSFAELVRAAGRRRLLEKTPSNSLRMGFVERVLPGCRFVHVMRHGVDCVLSIRRYWQDHAGGVPRGKLRERLREVRPRQVPHYAMELLRRMMPAKLAGPRIWGPRLPGIDAMAREMDLLEVCCLQWRTCVELACHYGRSLPADRYFECRLEDMSPDLVKRIMAFCELEDDPSVWSYFNERFDPSLSGARKARADEREVARIRQWIEPTMRWLGYD